MSSVAYTSSGPQSQLKALHTWLAGSQSVEVRRECRPAAPDFVILGLMMLRLPEGSRQEVDMLGRQRQEGQAKVYGGLGYKMKLCLSKDIRKSRREKKGWKS